MVEYSQPSTSKCPASVDAEGWFYGKYGQGHVDCESAAGLGQEDGEIKLAS